MAVRLVKKIVLFVSVLVLAGFAWCSAVHAADAPLDKAAVEKIVKDYIMGNPQVILDSVSDYQKKARTERMSEGLKKNKDLLLKDQEAPAAGNLQGDITVVEFFDYNCGYCKHAFPEVKALIEKDKNVRVVFREFPILGPTSLTASKWALAAHKQKKYFEFHAALMGNKSPITDEALEKLAKDTGLDVAQMKKDVAGPDVLAQVEKSRRLAESLGLTGTPAFVIGDEVVPGAIQLDGTEKLVAKARAAAPKK